MSYMQAIWLGILQGVAEFLPISSSGHLVLVERSFGLTPDLTLNVFLHLGTLGAIAVYYFKDLKDVTVDSVRMLFGRIERARRPFILKLGAATVVTAAMGFTLEKPIERLFASAHGNLWLAGMFSVTFLMLGSLFWLQKDEGRVEPTWTAALIIGVVQGLAVFPGISRSGSTIAVALIMGMSGPAAARFSFLLAVPVIAGAGLLHARKISSLQAPGPVVAGVLASLIVGFLSLWFLVKLIKRGKMAWFAAYILPLALYVALWGK